MEPTQTPVSQPIPTPSPAPTLVLTGPVELFSSSWKFFKQHAKTLIPIVILPSIISFISLLFITSGSGLAILGLILTIAAVIVSIAMQPAAVDAVQRLGADPAALLTVQGQYKTGFKYFWPLVLAIIIQLFVVLGSTVVFIIPGIIMSVYVSLYIFALIVDNKRGFAALIESYTLVKGRWWGVLGRMLFLALIYVVAAFVMVGITFLINTIFGFGSTSSGQGIVSSLLNLLMNAIMGPVTLIYVYKLYVSLKSTRRADTVPGAFKKWLIASICVGVLAVITLPIVGGILAVRFAKSFSANMAQQQQIIDALSQQASTTIPN